MDCSPCASVLWGECSGQLRTCIQRHGVAPAPEWQIRPHRPLPLAGLRVAAIVARLSVRRSDLLPHSLETPATLVVKTYAAKGGR
jgi:hypothetical protein